MKLFPHQSQAVSWLSSRDNALLADEQGLGKTGVAICAADKVGARRVLVLCPAVVLHNWAREFRMWSPARRTQVIVAGTAKVDLAVSVVVVSHSLATKAALFAQLASEAWDLVIVDESHAMKTPTAKRTQALFGKPGGAQINAPSIIRKAKRCWLLTGTPMPNNPSELWTSLAALAPDRIHAPGTQRPMSFFQFRDRYCVVQPVPYVRNAIRIVGARNVPELRQCLTGFMMRRMKKDHLDLPPIRWGTTTLTGPISPELKALEEQMLSKTGKAHAARREGLDDLLPALRETEEFSTWRRLCGECKAPLAAELLRDELTDTSHKIIVGAHHVSVLDVLQKELEPFGLVRISGDTHASDRQRAVDMFQGNTGIRVALVNIVAGGVGITLTAASDMVLVEQSFVPGDNAQWAARAHRIGQTQPVAVRVLTLAGSVDELTGEILARKSAMIQEVLK